MGKARRKKRKARAGEPVRSSPVRPEVEAPSRGPRGILAFGALALLTGLVYANALSNDFVFDDYDLVVDNEQIRSLDNIPRILGFSDARR